MYGKHKGMVTVAACLNDWQGVGTARGSGVASAFMAGGWLRGWSSVSKEQSTPTRKGAA